MPRLLFTMTFFVLIEVFSQSDKEQMIKVAKESCGCIGEISTAIKEKKKYKKIKDCINSANIRVQFLDGLGIKSSSDSTGIVILQVDSVLLTEDRDVKIDIDRNYREIEEHLLRDCESMKTLMASRDQTNRKSFSRKKSAKEHYDTGQHFFSQGRYTIAIEHYKNAVAEDEKFAFAWDMLGYSYRKLGDYDSAIQYYTKSLEIDPKGKMPLINMAYAYEYKEDFESAIQVMDDYINLYPNEGEGYYGRGRLFHKLGDYPNALEDTMKSYLMYNEVNSPYARDAEYNLVLFRDELKEKNQLGLFCETAKKYNIKIND